MRVFAGIISFYLLLVCFFFFLRLHRERQLFPKVARLYGMCEMSLVFKLRDGLLLPKELGNVSTILVIHQVPSHRIVVYALFTIIILIINMNISQKNITSEHTLLNKSSLRS